MPRSTDPALESLKERGWREVGAINDALSRGQIDEAGWHEAMASLIGPAYLAAESPYAQAGHGGDAATWEATRGFVAEALNRSGTFLDAGCANGILMESVHRWGAAKNLIVEPHGLDIVPELVELARRRLPQWADRIHLGNVRHWRPPAARFDYVLIRPEYAPAHRRAEMVRHVMDNVVKPKGRLIVLAGSEEVGVRRAESEIAAGGFTAHGRVEIPHEQDSRLMRRLFWIDGAAAQDKFKKVNMRGWFVCVPGTRPTRLRLPQWLRRVPGTLVSTILTLPQYNPPKL